MECFKHLDDRHETRGVGWLQLRSAFESLGRASLSIRPPASSSYTTTYHLQAHARLKLIVPGLIDHSLTSPKARARLSRVNTHGDKATMSSSIAIPKRRQPRHHSYGGSSVASSSSSSASSSASSPRLSEASYSPGGSVGASSPNSSAQAADGQRRSGERWNERRVSLLGRFSPLFSGMYSSSSGGTAEEALVQRMKGVPKEEDDERKDWTETRELRQIDGARAHSRLEW